MKKMQKLAILVCLSLFVSCSDTENHQATQLLEAISNIQANKAHPRGITPQILSNANSFIQKADSEGYELITPMDLHANIDEFVIIATLPRGIYNLGLIPNAKHFEFQTPAQKDWESDALKRSQEEFIHILGYNKQAKIVFYDEGSEDLSYDGSGKTGILWAKELGFTHLYYLVGGMKMWKKEGLPVSNEIPSCCGM